MATPPDKPTKPEDENSAYGELLRSLHGEALPPAVARPVTQDEFRRAMTEQISPPTSRPASPEPTGTTSEELAVIVAEEMARPFTHGRIPTDEERRAMREARAPLYRALAEGPDSTPATPPPTSPSAIDSPG